MFRPSSTTSSLFALLTSVFVLIAGNSLLNTLVPLRATYEAFPPVVIGILGSTYYFGMLAGTIAAPVFMRRAGLIRAFAAFTAMAIAAAISYPMEVAPLAWVLLRGTLGFAFAGLYTVLDAWINAKASNANRGHLYALYQVVTYGANAVGQQLPQFADPHGFKLFSTSAILLALSIVPISMTRSDVPAQSRSMRFSPRWLWRVSPIGVLTAFMVGAANGAFFSLAPVYALEIGGSPHAVSTFMTATVLGSALMVWPMGRLSDLFDRRMLIVALSTIGVAIELVLQNRAVSGAYLLPVIGFGIGASTMVLYTLGISHANDCGRTDTVVEVATGLLFAYCVGAILSPTLASAMMARFGAAALFGQNAVLHFTLAASTLYFTMTGKSQPAQRA